MSPNNVFRAIWSRRLFVAGTTLAIVAATVVAAFFLPRRYEATAELRIVDNGSVYARHGRPLPGAPSAAAVVRGVEGEILSNESLAAAAKAAGVAGDPAALKSAVRTAVRSETKGATILAVTVSAGDPDRAHSLATLLAAGYRNREGTGAAREAAAALSAARSESRDATARATAAAQIRKAFEGEHAEYRFGESDDAPARLADTRKKLADLDAEIAALSARRDEIQAGIAEEPAMIEVVEKSGDPARVAALEAELAAATEELSRLRNVFDDAHPRVKSQTQLVAETDLALAAARAELKTEVSRQPNPALAALKESERAIAGELTVKARMRDELAAGEAELAARAAEFPELAAKWTELVREADRLAAMAAAGAEKEEAARADLEAKAAAGALVAQVVRPADRPAAPTSPNRTLVAVAGVVAGLLLGGGLAAARNAMDRSFRDPEAVEPILETPLLGTIGAIETPAERFAASRRRRIAGLAVAMLFVAAGTAVFLQAVADGPITTFLNGALGRG